MTPPAVFFTPHQDDETLSMGWAIRNHLHAGREVHVVLMTDGSTSGVQPGSGLSVADFVLARDDEYQRACRALGVRPDNIHISPVRVASDSLTVAAALDVMREFVDRMPGVDLDLKTYSQLAAPGRHLDHQHAGQAACELLANKEIGTLRLYAEPWLKAAFQEANPAVHLYSERDAELAVVQGAFDVYATKDPYGFKFGIGKTSVPGPWTSGHADPTCWYHLPPG